MTSLIFVYTRREILCKLKSTEKQSTIASLLAGCLVVVFLSNAISTEHLVSFTLIDNAMTVKHTVHVTSNIHFSADLPYR